MQKPEERLFHPCLLEEHRFVSNLAIQAHAQCEIKFTSKSQKGSSGGFLGVSRSVGFAKKVAEHLPSNMTSALVLLETRKVIHHTYVSQNC